MIYWLLCCNFFLLIFRFCFNFLKEACGCMYGHSLWLSGKESSCNAGDTGDLRSIPGLGRSPGEGNHNPLQYSCLENPMDRGAWRATAHGVTNSWTQLSNSHAQTLLYYFNILNYFVFFKRTQLFPPIHSSRSS